MLKKDDDQNGRLRFISLCLLGIALWVSAHLFKLQIIEHDYYALFALNSHEIYQKLHPERGEIFFQDSRTHEVYPAAINRTYYLLYAIPKDIPADTLVTTTQQLIRLLGYTDQDKIDELTRKLSHPQSRYYQVIDKKISDEVMLRVKAAQLTGIYFTPQQFRYYPEENTGGPVLGFCSRNEQDAMVGKYGIEGYWDNTLGGKLGYIAGEKGRWGSWITLVGRKITPAENGANLVLTIDRTLQYQACKKLEEGRVSYKAKSASLVMMDPKSGAILAMCSTPDFNPNTYSQVDDVAYYNNGTVFNAYEPGSVFKPITMAMGIELGLVGPQTTFIADPCKFELGKGLKPIHNADNICYPGANTMTYVLQKSINTGMTWLVGKIGFEQFKNYVKKFKFGEKTGVQLNSEVSGNVSSLGQKINMYYASFGQSLAVTPLQLAVAYSALAHEGKLPHPYIVDEVTYANGTVAPNAPSPADSVVSSRTAKLVTGMLVATVDSYPEVKLEHYYVAGKTGTAQIFKGNRLEEKVTNHTIAGFAPANDARVVLVIRYEEPDKKWAGSTVGPVFKDIMKFVLEYYSVPQER